MQNVVTAGIYFATVPFACRKENRPTLMGDVREIKILQSSKNNDMIITEQVTCQLKKVDRIGETV